MNTRKNRRSITPSCTRWVAVIACAITPAALAQRSAPTERPALASQVNAAFNLRNSAVVTLDVQAEAEVPLTLVVPLDGQDYTLELLPHSNRAPEYTVYTQVDGALVEVEPGPVNTFRGTVLESPGSVVAASIEDNGLHTMVKLAGVEDRYWLEPVISQVAGADPDQYVVYRDGDSLQEGTCGVDHQHDFQDGHVDAPFSDGGIAGGPQECFWTADIAYDADWEYFQALGSVNNVENRINGTLNVMNIQYENQTDITHEVTAIIVRTEESDPYSGSLFSRLDQFRSHWNSQQQGIPRDVAEYYTGVNESGSVIGVAYTTNICNSSAYNIVENLGSLNCRADLAAHECGHNWSAGHCSCPSNTMNSGLTCAINFSQTSINSIVSYRIQRQFCLVNICIPDNDLCEDAISVGPGVTAYDNENAETDGFADALCSFNGDNDVEADVWFTYTAPCDATVTLSTADSGYDTKMAVYTFCPNGSNQAIACDDDSGPGNTSEITLAVTDGASYRIRVGGFEGATGSGQLTITESPCAPPAPSNDSCSSALPLLVGTTPFTTLGATTDGPDEPGSACDTAGSSDVTNDVWYRLVASCDQLVTVGTCGADFDTRIAVYGSTCPSGTGSLITCNDDSCGLQSEVTFDVSGGGIFRIRVGGYDGATGSGDVVVTCEAGESCVGDTNGDGFVNVDDLNNVILDWGTDGTANGGDVTGQTPGSPPDGAVDVNDLNLVIVNWGDCP